MEEQQQTNVQVNHSKNRRWIGAVLIIVIIAGGFYKLGYAAGHKGLTFDSKNFKIINQTDVPVTVDYNLLWDAIKAVKNSYIDKGNINDQKVLYGAVHGAVAAAGDDYTQFFDPSELNNFKTQLAGSFSGIGAEVGKQDGNIVIVAPLPDTPAARAGLKAKDIIVKINGEATTDMAVDTAVSKIRGATGSKVTLTLFRSGQTKTFDVTLIRETISIKSVKWEYKTVSGKNIAVVTISEFGDDTVDLFNKAVTDIASHKVDGIVLDLRNDPGGYLEAAVNVASQWVPANKVVVTEAHGDGSSIPYNSSGAGRLAGYKTVVLINGGSASASEILSGALHDYGIAKLVGEKSFGKGSVQQLFDLPGGSAVKVTIAKWITPGGKNLNKDGLVPDVAVKLSDDDIANKHDPQLDAALNEVTK